MVVNLLKLSPVENDASVVVLFVLGLSNDKWKLDTSGHAQDTSAFCLFPHLNFCLGAVRVIFLFRLFAFLFSCDLSDRKFEGECDLIAF